MKTFTDNVYALRFLYLLTQPWDQSEAFKQGIVDENGNKLREPTLDDDYSKFHSLVYNIRRTFEKLPVTKNIIARLGLALVLLKENNEIEQSEIALVEQIITTDKYACMLNENFTTGMDMIDKTATDEPVEDEQHFAGTKVFPCDHETFEKCRLGKRPYLRYKTYVGDDEVGEKIRQYGRQNPKKSIILKSPLGNMLYFKRTKH